jgi:hypothetical protein
MTRKPCQEDAQQRQPMDVNQINKIWNRVYPGQPLSQNIVNIVRKVEAYHGIKERIMFEKTTQTLKERNHE